ncbi:hypothetical protein BN136_2321 [Cronobacter universalis NCTC 9529]|nr:hypothetical protein BN136_2321 [Cronobacter universalis NCTC 9529]
MVFIFNAIMQRNGTFGGLFVLAQKNAVTSVFHRHGKIIYSLFFI